MTKEETVQYPAIKDYSNSGLASDLNIAIGVIEELEEEHDGAGDILKELRQVTDDYKIPSDVCETLSPHTINSRNWKAICSNTFHLEKQYPVSEA